MAISAAPSKGRVRESVRACLRGGETACRAGGGGGKGEGARLCATARGRLSAAGSPRLSRQRGAARHGQKVFSAPEPSAVAGSEWAMPGWEEMEWPPRDRCREIVVWCRRFPRL